MEGPGGRVVSRGMGVAAADSAVQGAETYWRQVVPGVYHQLNKPRASSLAAAVVAVAAAAAGIADGPRGLERREGRGVGQKTNAQQENHTQTSQALVDNRT